MVWNPFERAVQPAHCTVMFTEGIGRCSAISLLSFVYDMSAVDLASHHEISGAT